MENKKELELVLVQYIEYFVESWYTAQKERGLI